MNTALNCHVDGCQFLKTTVNCNVSLSRLNFLSRCQSYGMREQSFIIRVGVYLFLISVAKFSRNKKIPTVQVQQ